MGCGNMTKFIPTPAQYYCYYGDTSANEDNSFRNHIC